MNPKMALALVTVCSAVIAFAMPSAVHARSEASADRSAFAERFNALLASGRYDVPFEK
jgi:hypothetical protein